MSEEIFQLNLGEIPTAYDTQIAGIITQDNYEEKGEKPYNFTTQEIGKNEIMDEKRCLTNISNGS